MTVRRKSVLDIGEMVRRFRLGETDRRIAKDLEVSRNTVAGYRVWAGAQGLLARDALAEPSTIDQLVKSSSPPAVPGPSSVVEPFRQLVVDKRKDGVEMGALLQILREQGFVGSYSALRRFVRRLEPKARETGEGECPITDSSVAGLRPITRGPGAPGETPARLPRWSRTRSGWVQP